RAGDEEIVPHVADPPEGRPGDVVHYTGVLGLDGFATGVLVATHEGRPTKIDGNPAHPASAGGSLPHVQARILELYDPQRERSARLDGAVATWAEIAARLERL